MRRPDTDQATIEQTVKRATYRNPFITEFELQTEETDTVINFSIAEPLSPEQIREFGERVYDSFRDSGLLVNVIFQSYDNTKLTIVVQYTGQKVK